MLKKNAAKKKHTLKDMVVKPLPIHAEEDETITCEALDLLIMGGHQLKRNLILIANDLDLIKANKELCLALDFSELFTYLWPEKSWSHNRQVTRLLLNSQLFPFTMLPGTAVEFAKHIKRFIYKNEVARAKFSQMIDSSVANAFINSFRDSTSGQNILNITKGITELWDVLTEISHLDIIAEKLGHINQMNNMDHLSSIIERLDYELRPDVNILAQSEMSLNLRRPQGRELNNYIDAFNYSLVWQLTRAEVNKHDRIYLFVTSSPVPSYVFRNIKWGTDPDDLRLYPRLDGMSLVRHPIQVLYLSSLLPLKNEAKMELRYMINGLDSLLHTWESRPQYIKYKKGVVGPTDIVALPRSKRYLSTYFKFRKRYEQLFSSVRSAVESDLIGEENIRREKSIDFNAVGARVIGNLEESENITTTRLIYDIFDKVSRLAVKTLNMIKHDAKLQKHLLDWVDVENVISKGHRLRLKSEFNGDFRCIEVAAYTSPRDELYYGGDIYQDYYSLYWTSKVTIEQFLSAIRRFFANHDPKKYFEKYPHQSAKKKEFLGIYLFLQDKPEPIILPLNMFSDLNAGDLLGLVDGGRLLMVRVATGAGDFCYDYEAVFDLPQRVGFISHVKDAASLAYFIYETNQNKAGIPKIRQALQNTFKMEVAMEGIKYV